MVRVLTRELGLKLEARGSTTFKLDKRLKGTEPDECFYIKSWAAILGKRRFDMRTDPPLDLVVEVDITSESLTKFAIYAALGVPEIWRYHGTSVTFYHLAGDSYETSPTSPSFPFLEPAVVAEFLQQSIQLGQDDALDAFRAWVQSHKR